VGVESKCPEVREKMRERNLSRKEKRKKGNIVTANKDLN
jgi:hypothetical protein